MLHTRNSYKSVWQKYYVWISDEHTTYFILISYNIYMDYYNVSMKIYMNFIWITD